MLLSFFDHQGIIYRHEVPKNENHKVRVTSAYYCTMLRTLIHHIGCKRLKLKGKWILHYDNAWPHTSWETTAFFDSKAVEVMEHPPSALTSPLAIFGYSWPSSTFCEDNSSVWMQKLSLLAKLSSTLFSLRIMRRLGLNIQSATQSVLNLKVVILRRNPQLSKVF